MFRLLNYLILADRFRFLSRLTIFLLQKFDTLKRFKQTRTFWGTLWAKCDDVFTDVGARAARNSSVR